MTLNPNHYKPDEIEQLPATACLLSLFVPGAGQLWLGQVGVASAIFVLWALGWLLHASLVWLFMMLVGAVHGFVYGRIARARLRELQSG